MMMADLSGDSAGKVCLLCSMKVDESVPEFTKAAVQGFEREYRLL